MSAANLGITNPLRKEALKVRASDMLCGKPQNHIWFLDPCLPLPPLRGFPANVHTIYFPLLFEEEQQPLQHADLEQTNRGGYFLPSRFLLRKKKKSRRTRKGLLQHTTTFCFDSARLWQNLIHSAAYLIYWVLEVWPSLIRNVIKKWQN